jgi:hypothetical protein
VVTSRSGWAAGQRRIRRKGWRANPPYTPTSPPRRQPNRFKNVTVDQVNLGDHHPPATLPGNACPEFR